MRQENTSISKVQIIGFLMIYAILFALIIYKAFTLPITHDESWTIVRYVPYSPWEIMMYPDEWPNNHILNTLLTKLTTSIFGVHDWSARLPNLMFFPVYAWGVYRLLKAALRERKHLFLPAALVFVLSPYFLDFFALCRGYGISSALTMLSLSFFVSGFLDKRNKHIWWGLILATLASYANFTVLVYWAAAVCTTALYFMIYKKSWAECIKRWAVLLVICLGYAALIALPIYKMKSTDQFVYWSSQGFYQDTILSVVHNSLSDSRVFTRADWVSKLVILHTFFLWIVGLVVVFRFRFRREAFRQPLVVVGLVLLLTVGINLIQTNVLGDPNLNGRTALFLMPLFCSLLVTGLILVPSGRFRGVGNVFAGLMILVAIQHLTTTTRLSSFKEWRYDAFTFEVLDYVKENSVKEEVSLDAYWLYFNSLYFYKEYESYPWLKLEPHRTDVNTESNADYYYVPLEFVDDLKPRFKPVKQFLGGGTIMKRVD